MSEVLVKADKMQENLYVAKYLYLQIGKFNHESYHLVYWAHNNDTDLREEILGV